MMGTMKDSGVEWIGKIPEDWTVCRISQTGHYINGFAFKPDDWGEDGLPIIRIQDLSGSNDSPNYFNGQIDKKYLVHHGDLLVSWAATLDAYRWQGDDAWLNQHIFKVINADGIDEKFLRWLLATAIRHLDSGNKHGIMMQHLTWGMFAHCPVPLPPFQYQSLLGKTLDKYCGRIDRATVLLEKEISTLERYRASVIHEAVTRGLDPAAPTKPSGVDWIGDIPEGWDVRPLGYLGSFQNGISKDGASFGEGFPFVSYGDVYKNRTLPREVKGLVKSNADERVRYSVKRGDVFFTRTSETAAEIAFSSTCFTTIENATFAGFLIRFRPNTENLDIRFSSYYFRDEGLRNYFVKEMMIVTRASLGQQLLKRLPVLLPPLKEQAAIADYLDARTAAVDAVLDTKRKQLDVLKRRRQSLIYEYVTGKRRVSKEA